jgi:hypothetical protein
MFLENAVVYLPEQYNERVPVEIIKYFKAMQLIKEHENILMIFGDLKRKATFTSVAALENRLEYVDCTHVWPINKTIFYSDISRMSLVQDDGCSYINIIDKSEKQIRLNVRAETGETSRFYDFISTYKEPERQMSGLEVVAVSCPNCGASFKAGKGAVAECEYCGTKIRV